jgi:hypothetical protein
VKFVNLTRDEIKVWIAVQIRDGFYRHWPRWAIRDSGFRFEYAPDRSLGEVFRYYDGTWHVSLGNGENRVFDTLTEEPFLLVEYRYYHRHAIETENRYRAVTGGREPAYALSEADDGKSLGF